MAVLIAAVDVSAKLCWCEQTPSHPGTYKTVAGDKEMISAAYDLKR